MNKTTGRRINCTILIIALCAIGALFSMSVAENDGYAEAASDFDTASYRSRAGYLVDYDTGTVLLDKNSDDRYPIASMVKIMTLLLTFDEADEGRLSFDEKIVISDYAMKMGGSQMFLKAGEEYLISDLVKGVVVCSANDAATALGERISGNIESFVAKMNAYAKELGMENTLFANATGLPDSGEQYSSAKDVCIMFGKLLEKEKYYEYSKIWMEDYTHPDGRVTQLVNTNKMIRFYKNCDAGKTGYTDEARHCLAASAKVNGLRVVGVVLGAEDSKIRFKEMTDMFNYAFANYEIKTIIKRGDVIPGKVNVAKAKNIDKIELYADNDIKYFTRKNAPSDYEIKFELTEGLNAPVSKETPLGKVKVVKSDGEIICEADIYSKYDIEKIRFKDSLEKVLKNWLAK